MAESEKTMSNDYMKHVETAISKYAESIELRKKNIYHCTDILSGKDKSYDYNLDYVQRQLEANKQALNVLLTDSFYTELIEDEKKKLLELCK